MDPKSASAYESLGIIYLNENKIDAAKKFFLISDKL